MTGCRVARRSDTYRYLRFSRLASGSNPGLQNTDYEPVGGLVAHHREPVPLYPLLEEAGFAHEIEKLGENRFRLRIRRKDG